MASFICHARQVSMEKLFVINGNLLEQQRLRDYMTGGGNAKHCPPASMNYGAQEMPDATQQRILDVAIEIMGSDFATMQLYDNRRHGLRLVTNRGFPDFFAEQFAWVFPDSGTSCAQVLKTHRRVVIGDIDNCDLVIGTRENFRSAGIFAMQSTPLLHTDGHLIGMCSTHWRQPHRPNRAQLRLFDVWSRQLTDVLLQDDEVSRLLHDALTQIDRNRQLIDEFEQLTARKVKWLH